MRWLRSLRIKDVLKFLPLGVLLPVGIGAASVSPHDAISNISKWIEFIGVRDVPTWVAQKSADRTFLEFCVFLSIIYAIFIFRRQLSAFVLKDQFERLQRPSGDSMSMSVLVGKEAIAAAGTLTPTIDRFTPLAVSDSQHIEQRLIVVLTRNVPFHSE